MIYGSASLRDLEGELGLGGGGGLRCGPQRNISGLDHEAGHDAVEWNIIVHATCAQSKEVFGCLGDCFAEELDLEVALGRVELDRS